MNVFYKGARMIKDMYNQLNPATLTGAIDILVIEQENEDLVSSPFHVRFGKLGVLRAKEKLVDITINDEVVDLHMKLGDQGEAFFVVDADDEEVPARLLTSPLPSRPVSPCNEEQESDNDLSPDDSAVKQRKRKKRRKQRRSISSLSNEAGTDFSQSSDSEDTLSTIPSIEQCPKQKHPPEPQLSLDQQNDDETSSQYKRLCNVFSDSELPPGHEDQFPTDSQSPFSDSEALARSEVGTPVGWDWGELPIEKQQTLTVPSLVKSKLVLENEKRTAFRTLSAPAVSKSEENQKFHFNGVDKPEPIKEERPTTLITSSREGSPKKKSTKRPPEGLYLDEILDLAPNEANLYFSTKQDDKSTDAQDVCVEDEKITSEEATYVTSDAGIDSGTDCVVSDDIGDPMDLSVPSMTMSLCGGKLEDGKLVVDEDKFREKLVTYDQFIEDPVGITHHSELVIQLGDRYCDLESSGPLLLSLAMFQKPLSNNVLESVIDRQMSKKMRATSASRLSWLWRRGSHRDSTSSTHSDQGIKDKEASEQSSKASSKQSQAKSLTSVKTNGQKTDESSSAEEEMTPLATKQKELKRAQTVQALISTPSVKHMRKTTRLTSDQLKSLNLKPGANTVTFSVTSQYQGTSRCIATIYLWKWTDRLVVSDIDGTITKSDVFGQILPVVGKDWTQSGVAQLYDNISKNGYKFIYLSARAIGQAAMTKGYLNWINQRGVSLPPGPLFLSPTSLISAFKTEVIKKEPEKFKIQCLEDIKALFPPGHMPLTAGFGNKKNDVVAYTSVGIPERRIFTINPKGELKPEDMLTYTTSYSALGGNVDNFFPATDCRSVEYSDNREFSEFNYWRSAIPEIVIDDPTI